MVTTANRIELLDFPRTPSGCIEFDGTTSRGYGRVRVGDKKLRAHRYSYSVHVGEIGDMHVLHACDNPLCVNPEHLFLGTAQDNTQDKIDKGRQARNAGHRNGNSKLNVSQVMDALTLTSLGYSQEAVGRVFGVSAAAISQIVTGRSWGHVTGRALTGAGREPC